MHIMFVCECRWAVNTSTGVVDVALNLSSSVGSRSVVRYTPQTHHDFGELLCWAVNDLGLQHQPCVFKVVPAGRYILYILTAFYIILITIL